MLLWQSGSKSVQQVQYAEWLLEQHMTEWHVAGVQVLLWPWLRNCSGRYFPVVMELMIFMIASFVFFCCHFPSLSHTLHNTDIHTPRSSFSCSSSSCYRLCLWCLTLGCSACDPRRDTRYSWDTFLCLQIEYRLFSFQHHRFSQSIHHICSLFSRSQSVKIRYKTTVNFSACHLLPTSGLNRIS